MKRKLAIGLLVGLAVVAGSEALRAQSTTPEAGGVRVLGSRVSAEQYHLQVEVGADAGWFAAGAVVVRSEPSGTVLTALVSAETPVTLLGQVQGMRPQSLGSGPLFGALANLYQAPPPSGDTRVIVEYLVQEGGAWVPFVVADANLGSLDAFQFIATPDGGGGGFQYCEWCGEVYCGCIRCPTPSYTRCCPSCMLVCGMVIC